MDALHDSRKLVYRSPFGALPLGEEVTLSIDVLDAEGVSCSLRLWIDGEGETLLPMEGTPIEGGTRFTITYEPAQTAVVWYFFQLRQGEEICWYGAKDGQTGGEGQLRWGGHPGSFQITVYEPRAVPDWYRKGIVYQIFPDRFRRDADWRKRTEQALSTPRAGIERRLVEDWYQRPRYERDGKGHILHWDFYGGSLRGIIEKLDYLKNLGITVLYLNPIFEAASNHRYDTGDYELIDPILGTEEDFRALVSAAEERGISLILDGVFNHTGRDSRYFNRFGNYGPGGAWQDKNSPYRSWFKFDNSPLGYSAWWGVEDLPDTMEEDPAYRAYINGEDGIVRRWLRAGARGWRLDVADELPDAFIEELKSAVVAEKGEDGLVIGEVWEDASNKIAYGELRRYLLGAELDGTMNYPVRDILGSFLLGDLPAQEAERQLWQLYENYPRSAFYAALNLIGSHDRTRSLTLLGGAPQSGLSESEQAVYQLSPAQRQLGKSRMWLAVLMQMTLPGVPSVYYGDEAGLEGYADPFNRAGFPWGKEDADLFETTRNGIGLRRLIPLFVDGDFTPVHFGSEVFGFWRRLGDESALVLVNRSRRNAAVLSVPAEHEECTELVGNVPVPFRGREVTIRLPQLGSAVLFFHKKQRLAAPLAPGRGVLCHITSLPNAAGPGTIREPALRFVDWAKEKGFKYWQILPLNPTDAFGSPYAGSSAFAGNIALLGYTEAELREQFAAFAPEEDYRAFVEREGDWLEPFAVYEVLSHRFHEAAWQTWPAPYRAYTPALLEEESLRKEAEYYKFTQYLFERHWSKVRRAANEAGIQIIGDIPMYVSAGSCDCWADPASFELDADGNPALVAGVPPDYFSKEGQLWGNPIFKWEKMARDGYRWWLMRFRRAFRLYDFVRLDHFRGFESYWAVPAGEKAVKGKWVFGPGMALFEAAYREFGPLKFLAEDLGHITPGVRALLTRTGFLGTDVMQFSDGDPLTHYEPPRGKVCYSGTHDNQTLLGWARERYPANDEAETVKTLLRNLDTCGADVIILPLQDILGLDDSARMNTPGTTGGNWCWQAKALN